MPISSTYIVIPARLKPTRLPRNREVLDDPNCVKVVCDELGRALYFSRSPIPYVREWSDDLLSSDPPAFLLHLGIYAYRREFLLSFSTRKPARIEDLERLEQLRVLAAGHRIAVGIVAKAPPGLILRKIVVRLSVEQISVRIDRL